MAQAKTYQVFNAGRREKVRLDLNENAWGCSPKVLAALENLSPEDISLYPAYDSFISQVAEHYQIATDQVIISNGADDSIRCLFDTFVEEGDEILLPVPNYGMFDIFGRIRGAKITEILYPDDFSFPVIQVLAAISPKIKLIIIVNPANPLGTVIPEQGLLQILDKAVDSLVLLDETYWHFVEKSYVKLIKEYPNLILVQTFSKAYGLTGLRLGMLFSTAENIRHLAKVNLPFAVNNLALIAGSAALADQEFIQQVVRNVRMEMQFLQNELNQLGIETRTCQTNFLLMKVGDQADEIYQALQQRNVLVRNLNKYPLLKGYLRVSIGRREDNLRFLEALRLIMKI
ncbi:MAG: histidinol-phosphate transaminase [candidate division KSB1 bacterium]|nr:histidinol-phosphate transaminase [candidate division KSB1 bacterium]